MAPQTEIIGFSYVHTMNKQPKYGGTCTKQLSLRHGSGGRLHQRSHDLGHRLHDLRCSKDSWHTATQATSSISMSFRGPLHALSPGRHHQESPGIDGGKDLLHVIKRNHSLCHKCITSPAPARLAWSQQHPGLPSAPSKGPQKKRGTVVHLNQHCLCACVAHTQGTGHSLCAT